MNQLTRLDEFKTILSDYKLSDDAQKLLTDMTLVLLVGPSSAGRNTIINKLVESGSYHSIVSDTTRLPRVNNGIPEENGREYWFRAEADILHDLQNGQFLEAAIIHEQQVSGISMRELATAAKQGKIAINEIEVVGADNIHATKPDTLFLFVLPPSFDEWMVRMQTRGTLPAEEIRRRLSSAVNEITIALQRDYYHFVVNDTFAHTAERINKMSLQHIQQTEADQAAGRKVAQQLLADTQEYLGE
jgi:guanylate kinase